MTKRKRGIDIVTPPHGVTIPEEHRTYSPVLIQFTYHRALWITSEKVISPGNVEFHWVLADRDGNAVAVVTCERANLPALFKNYLKE